MNPLNPLAVFATLSADALSRFLDQVFAEERAARGYAYRSGEVSSIFGKLLIREYQPGQFAWVLICSHAKALKAYPGAPFAFVGGEGLSLRACRDAADAQVASWANAGTTYARV